MHRKLKAMKNKLILGMLLLLTFAACKKDEATNNDESEWDELVGEQATLDNFSSDDDLIFTDYLNRAGRRPFPAAPCLTVTHDTTVTPRLITLDYGSTPCLCSDGRYRRGIVQIAYSGTPPANGSTATISYNNYFIDRHQINGSRTMTHTVYPGTNNPARIRTANITVTNPRSMAMTRTENDTIEFFAGWATDTIRLDDVYLIRGNASGNRGRFSFNRIINTPLRREASCNWLTAGNVSMQQGNRAVRIIDYGNGNCDNQATITVNGNTRTITLP